MSTQPPLKIPNKLFFRIGEVSEITGVQPYTLRHWEMEFPTLSPKKNDAGQRLYRRADIEMVREIQRLLHHEGYTTAGAVRRLSAKKRARGKLSSFPVPPPPPPPSSPRSEALLLGVREALAIMEATDAGLAALLDPAAVEVGAKTKSPAGAKGGARGSASRPERKRLGLP